MDGRVVSEKMERDAVSVTVCMLADTDVFDLMVYARKLVGKMVKVLVNALLFGLKVLVKEKTNVVVSDLMVYVKEAVSELMVSEMEICRARILGGVLVAWGCGCIGC